MREEIPLLTKSDYLDGLICVKRLFLKKYHAELEAAPDQGSKARMEAGKEIGILARELFSGGLLIGAWGPDGVIATKIGMGEADVLFEAQFEAKGRFAKVDVLERAGSAWRIIEVKSSKAPDEGKSFKSTHLEDLAFQVLVLKEAGVEVASAHLLLVSRDYKLSADGELDIRSFFTMCDVTARVEKLLEDANFRSIAMMENLKREAPPEAEINVHCESCGFFGHCAPDLQEDDLIFLPAVKRKEVTQLRCEGIRSIREIPDASKLTAIQRGARHALRSGKPYLSEKLAEELSDVRYPLCFVDFEAASWAIPVLPGTVAHQAIPFQWSCHVQQAPNAPLEHFEFLARDSGDPRAEFAGTLLDCLKNAGTVLVYSSYEKTRVRDLSFDGFVEGERLERIFEERQMDLYNIVRQNVYWPAFRGSFSLKDVLPAIVPSLGYSDLIIQEGNQAAAEYKRMLAAEPPVADEVARNLLAYCERDTLAMVELFAELRKIAGIEYPIETGSGQLALNL